jgi:5-methylcytosine-specific restriction endonuclease McrA
VRRRSGDAAKSAATRAQNLEKQPDLDLNREAPASSDPDKEAEAGASKEVGVEMEVLFELKAQLDSTSKANLESIRELLRHRLPNGNLNDVLRVVLQQTVDRLRAEKSCALKKPTTKAPVKKAKSAAATVKAGSIAADVDRPRLGDPAPLPPPSSTPLWSPLPATLLREDGQKRRGRSIPRAVRRAVYARDGGQCTWMALDGRQCKSRAFLEYNHRRAFALGGEHTVDNINLLCRAHNQLEGVEVFGKAAMQGRRGKADGGKQLDAALRAQPSLQPNL